VSDAAGDSRAHFVGYLCAAASIAVPAVLFTGVFNAERGLVSFLVPLTNSDWELILSAKLGPEGAAIVFGWD
jgi:putative copper resistance protein D